MRLPARRPDDADVIRARLRALLAEGRGWIPDDVPGDGDGPGGPRARRRESEDAFDDEAGDEVDGGPFDEDAGTAGHHQGRSRARHGHQGVEEALPAGGRHRAPDRAVRLAPGRRAALSLWAAAVGAVLLLLLWTWLDRPTAAAVPESAPGLVGAPTADDPTAVPPAGAADAAGAAGVSTLPTPAVSGAAGTSSTVVVSVVGLVGRPGLVTLAGGSRVADAIDAAGGLLPDADPASVNLAAVVADGQQVAVGVPGAAGPAPALPGAAARPGTAGTSAGGAPGGVVPLNTASAAELDALPGIGPVLAGRIVEHRAQHGPFARLEDLQDVPGIGPAILDGLSGAVTV